MVQHPIAMTSSSNLDDAKTVSCRSSPEESSGLRYLSNEKKPGCLGYIGD